MRRTPSATPQSTKGISGTENFSFGTGRAFGDNEEYASLGITFDILAIDFEPGRGYEGRDRWALRVKATDRDAQILSLGSNPGRDEELRAAQEHLKNGGTITNKRLRRKDGAYYINDGDR